MSARDPARDVALTEPGEGRARAVLVGRPHAGEWRLLGSARVALDLRGMHGRQRYLAPNRLAASAVEEERGEILAEGRSDRRTSQHGRPAAEKSGCASRRRGSAAREVRRRQPAPSASSRALATPSGVFSDRSRLHRPRTPRRARSGRARLSGLGEERALCGHVVARGTRERSQCTAAKELAVVRQLVAVEARARSCGRARPRRPARAARPGRGADRLADRRRRRRGPTKSSSASGPIGCPAPSVMQVSIVLGAQPGLAPAAARRSNRYGNSSRLTTKPGDVRDLDGGLAERLAQREGARARLLAWPAGGNASSIELHLRHRVEHVQADEALGCARSPRRARRPTATRWWSRGSRRRRAARPPSVAPAARALAAGSSTTASTTNVALGQRVRVA